jgi:hypothetical protein
VTPAYQSGLKLTSNMGNEQIYARDWITPEIEEDITYKETLSVSETILVEVDSVEAKGEDPRALFYVLADDNTSAKAINNLYDCRCPFSFAVSCYT